MIFVKVAILFIIVLDMKKKILNYFIKMENQYYIGEVIFIKKLQNQE